MAECQPSSENVLYLLTLNIRSLRSNFENFLAHLHLLDTKYDLIVLTETWIQEEELSSYPIPDYASFVHSRKDGRRSGGVVVYVRKEISVKVETAHITTGNGIKLEIVTSDGTGGISILSLYRDWASSIHDFCKDLSGLLPGLQKRAIVLGDMNINLINTTASSEYLNLLTGNGFTSLQNEPTREESCIDHLFVREPVMLNDDMHTCNLILPGITDHLGISAALIFPSVNKSRNKKRETVKKINHKNLYAKILTTDWSWLDSVTDTNTAFSKFVETTHQHIMSCTREVIIKYKPRNPWVNTELATLVDEKNKLYRTKKDHPQNEELRKLFTQASKRVCALVRQLKKNYYTNKLNEHANSHNKKKYWNLINNVKGNKSHQISEINANGVTLSCRDAPLQVANVINENFVQAPEKLITENNLSLNQNFTKINQLFTSNDPGKFEIKPFSSLAIVNAIDRMKNKDTCGLDKITLRIVKENIEVFAYILEKLI